jgi:squalene-associated FAD-dependent desaturase
MAGLSAAVRLAAAGYRVGLFEAGPQAGGRCRSYFDDRLGCRLDNGNHLLLSGNRSTMDYLDVIGARGSLIGPAETRFPFVDLSTGEHWALRPNRGPIPFWLLDRRRRVPGTSLHEYLSFWRLLRARPHQSVAELADKGGLLYRRFWQPLAVAVLNTEAEHGAASLLVPVLRETFGRGAGACRPLVAAVGLSESFVDPALAWLDLRGGRLFTGSRVRALGFEGGRAARIDLGGEIVDVGAQDVVVLAVPPGVAADLLPGLTVPTEFRPIVNAHFVLPGEAFDGVSITGVIGGTVEWIFRRGTLASVTISSATSTVDEPAESLAPRLWSEVAAALSLPPLPVPPWRIVKEKRATFAQTPAQVALRPHARTAFDNLTLAGDWTDTGLPATIEGAIRSGATAAGSFVR